MTRFRTTLPAERNYDQWAQEQKQKRWDYWTAVRKMREEYMAENAGVYDLTTRPSLHYWAEGKYGFKMGLDGTGDYTAEYTVVDSKKFLLFQIKYWQ